uniref:SUN domain-containing protein n=1 Tax=Macrostomum lignano TaxID=282301 RepID=A0A1I8JPR1_9PLAT
MIKEAEMPEPDDSTLLSSPASTACSCGVSPGLHLQPALPQRHGPEAPDYVFLQATKSLAWPLPSFRPRQTKPATTAAESATLTAAVVSPAVGRAARKFRGSPNREVGSSSPLDEAEAANRLLADSGRWPTNSVEIGRLSEDDWTVNLKRRGGGAAAAALEAARLRRSERLPVAARPLAGHLSSWLPVGRESGFGQPAVPQPVRDRSQLGRLADAAIWPVDTADGPVKEAIAAVNSTDQLLSLSGKLAEGLAVRVLQQGRGAYLLMAGSGLAFMLAWLLMLAVIVLCFCRPVLHGAVPFLNWQSGASGLPGTDTVASAYTRRYQPDRMRENGARSRPLLGDCRPVSDVRPGLAGALNLPELVNGTKPDRAFRRLSTRSVQLLNSRGQPCCGLRLRPNLTELIRQAGAARTVDLSACAGSLTTSGSLTAAASADVIRRDPDGAGIAPCTGYRPPPWPTSPSIRPAGRDLIRTLGRLSDQRRRVQQLSDARTRLIDLVGPDGRGGSRLATRLGVADSSIRRSDALSEAIDAGAGANLTVGLSAGLVDAAAAALSGVADCRKISDAAKGAVRAPCQSALRPFNGFWAGLGPLPGVPATCLVFSLKLVNLYRKSSKYERTLRSRAGKSRAGRGSSGRSRGGGGSGSSSISAIRHYSERDTDATAVAVARANRRCQQFRCSSCSCNNTLQYLPN